MPVRDQRNRLKELETTLIDITAQTQAQAALRESEKNLRALLDGLAPVVGKFHGQRHAVPTSPRIVPIRLIRHQRMGSPARTPTGLTRAPLQ